MTPGYVLNFLTSVHLNRYTCIYKSSDRNLNETKVTVSPLHVFFSAQGKTCESPTIYNVFPPLHPQGHSPPIISMLPKQLLNPLPPGVFLQPLDSHLPVALTLNSTSGFPLLPCHFILLFVFKLQFTFNIILV